MSGPELKQCPFCGDEAFSGEWEDAFRNKYAGICCGGCLAEVALPVPCSAISADGQLAEAIEAWNTRAALPEVQAIVDAAVEAALDDVTTLHRVIADIRAETVGHKPMLSELPQALVQWRDAAAKAERGACVAECQHIASALEYDGNDVGMRAAEHCASAIRKRGEG